LPMARRNSVALSRGSILGNVIGLCFFIFNILVFLYCTSRAMVNLLKSLSIEKTLL
jgi:hypothetical protein